jgi:hypothetical protein
MSTVPVYMRGGRRTVEEGLCDTTSRGLCGLGGGGLTTPATAPLRRDRRASGRGERGRVLAGSLSHARARARLSSHTRALSLSR